MLWHGFAFDEGRLDRVVQDRREGTARDADDYEDGTREEDGDNNDEEEVQRLDIMLSMSGGLVLN